MTPPGPEFRVPHPQVRLCLLGSWQLHHAGSTPVSPGGQRLLAFLALHGRQNRVHMAATLWPDIDDELASGRLRSLIWRLNKSVLELFDLTGGCLALHPRVQDDVSELSASATALINGSAPGRERDTDAALAMLGGPELLLGWYDDWVLVERDRLNDLRVHALEALVDRFIESGRAGEALRAARLAMRIDPFRESAHRAAIRALLAEGNPASALRHYDRYQAFVRTELGIDQPTEQMMATVGTLLAG
jgi:DNA-binding SARP family transcriptional activator